jgi:hypothetical protein
MSYFKQIIFGVTINTMFRFPQSFLVLAFLLSSISATFAQSSSQFALLMRYDGTLTLERSDGSQLSQPARGERVFAGDTVLTGANSSALIIFPTNQTTLNLAAETRLTLNTHRFAAPQAQGATETARSGINETELTLDYGDIVGKVETLDRNAPNHRFEVRTPVGVAGVRGTIFRIRFVPPAPGQPPVLTISTTQGLVVMRKNVVAGVTQNTQVNSDGESETAPAEESGTVETEIGAGSELEVLVDIDTETGEITVVSIESGQTLDPAVSEAIAETVENIELTTEETAILAQAEGENLEAAPESGPGDTEDTSEDTEEASEESGESESAEDPQPEAENSEGPETGETEPGNTNENNSPEGADAQNTGDEAPETPAETPPVAPLPEVQVENVVTPGAGA